MVCESFEQPSIRSHFSADGVVHDLGNLIQIAASAVNIIGRSPHNRGGAMLEPTIARARTALLQAGALVRQTVRPSGEPTLTLWRAADLQDIGSCLEEISALVAWTCQPDIALSMEIAEDLPRVACNRIELQNAILNLVINACDATPRGGAIRIVARLEAASPDIELTVADNGVGMSRETLLAAFRPYFTTKSQGRGAGLGLSMVHRFAEQAGGRVDIESAPGAGAAVTIRLPAGAPDGRGPAVRPGDQTTRS